MISLNNFKPWWTGLSARERRLLGLAGALLVIWVLWTTAIQPALRTWREAPAKVEAARTRLAQMEAMSHEAARVRSTSTASATGSLQAPRNPGGLDANTRDLIVQHLGADARMEVQGRLLTLQFEQADAEGLRQAMKATRSRLKVRLTEANLAPTDQGLKGRLQFEWQDG